MSASETRSEVERGTETFRLRAPELMRSFGGARPLTHAQRLAYVEALMRDGEEHAAYAIAKATRRLRRKEGGAR